MIDYKKLYEIYDRDGIYALQLEVGDVCFQNCIYCYMNALPEERNTLSDVQITRIIKDSAELGIAAIEWLGGEPLLRESIFNHLAHARDLGFRNNMWTGGLPFEDDEIVRKTAELCRHGLISFHISTINPELYKQMHPERPVDDMNIIIDGVKKLLDLGYPPEQLLNSVTYTGMQSAAGMIETIDYFEEEFGVKTSLNVYHTYLRPGTKDEALHRFIPDRGAVARVHKRYSRQWGMGSQMPMNCVNKQYCSATAAVLSDGHVTPCATIRDPESPSVHSDGSLYDIVNNYRDYLIFKYFKKDENLPVECRQCNIAADCFGCRSRSYAAGLGLYGKDPRCFKFVEY